MWSRQVLAKYWALQVAGWIGVFVAAWFAAELFDWPRKVVWIIVGVCVAKDVMLYPLVWRAYEHHDSHASAYPRVSAEGAVLPRLEPEGAVRIAGERWKAAAASGVPIGEGERVRVAGRDGMTLIVEPAQSSGERGNVDAARAHGSERGDFE